MKEFSNSTSESDNVSSSLEVSASTLPLRLTELNPDPLLRVRSQGPQQHS